MTFILFLMMSTQISFGQIDSIKSFKFDYLKDSLNAIRLFSGNGLCTIDSLIYWSYDTICYKNRKTDFDPICLITFYRNVAINDTTFKQNCGKERYIIPQMTFYVYPIILADSIHKVASKLAMCSNCNYPNSGPDVYFTKNFVFYDHSLCKRCSTQGSIIDLCRGNIRNIFSFVKYEEYTSFGDLLDDLPIKHNKLE